MTGMDIRDHNGHDPFESDTGIKMLQGEQASEEALNTIASKAGLPDFESWKAQNMAEYSGGFEEGVYEVAIAAKAFPGLEKLSNEERNELVGAFTTAAVKGSDTELASAVQALGGSSDFSLDDYRQLGGSITNNHENLHGVTKAPQSGEALAFLLSHFGYTNEETGRAGQNANGDTDQPGVRIALGQLN
jgi:hypothetical protein